MTVAAVILSASAEGALAPTEGQPRLRRLVDIAWSGGAVPIVAVAPDPDGAVAASLAGAPVTLAEPAPAESGPIGQIVHGLEVAFDLVRETDAALVWPARLVWVDPETITSLIEAHGVEASPLLRPTFAGEPGWPVLVPRGRLEALRGIARDRMPGDLIDDLITSGVPERRIDTGDPGVTHDADVARSDLPPFRGPAEPPGGHVHEWGSPAAERNDDAPLEGPGLAPYGQADAGDPDQPG
ncbi:MAG TPA: NTP transferase domain-containing protein [Candidatus Limnocylindrales bacterium]